VRARSRCSLSTVRVAASASFIEAMDRWIDGDGVVLDWPDLPDLGGWTWVATQNEKPYWVNWRLRTAVLNRVEKYSAAAPLSPTADSSGAPPASAAATVHARCLPRLRPKNRFSVS
jgi:hypothetical protein